MDGLHSDVEPLNGDAQVIDRDAMWRSKMHALWIIFKAGRTAERQAAFDQFKTDFGSDLEAYARGACVMTSGVRPRHKATIGNRPLAGILSRLLI